MKAILRSDYFNLKQSLKTMITLPIFFMIIAFISKNMTFLGTVLIMMCLMLPINLFSYDTAYGWDKLMLSLPISRAHVIISKYIFCFGIMLGTFLFMAAGGFIFSRLHPSEDFFEMLSMLLFCASVALLLIAITLPLIVKFGIIKGRYIMMAVVLIPTMLIVMLPTFAKDISFHDLDAALTGASLAPMGFAFLAITCCIHVLSALISIRIYRKKEF